ncbi:transposase [Mycolicibacterium mageritense DSM 44476 = CIP 104973]|uniref:Transposase/integrase n=1 Tax=Mycolicibacterium mageritense TaxID=53462 RepID=A0ABM7HKX1_MYCME|nr:hypothetical protein [Mycolicibacterium mageritense]BBX31143.1 putative transposase/integrase [Mycolicibacterium mageritense]CDO24892.1 transposase [Mycolicibacterium mageritense DSM 44476 = CIP 104973]
MSPVTEASRQALAAHTRRRRDAVTARIEKTLKAMRREKAAITVSSVARRAKVTRPSIHRRPELLAMIKAHERLSAVDTDTPPTAAASGESGLVAALRSRLITKEEQIAELRSALRERDRTIATLHGEIDRLNATRRRP